MIANEVDIQIRDWLRDERPMRTPDWLMDATAVRVDATRRRPGWLVTDRWTWGRSPSGGGAIARRSPSMGLVVVLGLVGSLVVVAVGLLIVGGGIQPRPPIPADRGVFTATAPMAFIREAATATTLEDGRVLVIGGFPDRPTSSGSGDDEVVHEGASRTAEIWDPVTGVFSRTGDLKYGRWSHAAVRLADGRVLVVAGYSPGQPETQPDGSGTQYNDPTTSAEIWDPATGRFAPAGDLPRVLAPIAAWLEADGRVRVVGQAYTRDTGSGGPWLAALWDATSLTFTEAPATGESMPGVRLDDGRRLWADGLTALLWDPLTAAMAPLSTLPEFATKTALPDGRILVAGGAGGVDLGERQDLMLGCGPDAALWDPVTGLSSQTGSLGVPRGHQAAAVLQDGRVLVVGNYWTCDEPSTAEIFAFP